MSKNGASSCQVCETDRYAHVLLRLPESSYAKCDRCGFVYLNGDRSMEEQHGIYQVDQFEDGGYMGTFDMEEVAQEQFESMETILGKAGATSAVLRTDQPHLDIGCARGFFLRRLSATTGRTHLMGVDTSPGMTAWGRREFGLDLRAGAIEHTDLPVDHFSSVTMFDVLEHVAFPRQVLERIIRSLAPGGWMVIEVPSETTSFRLATRVAYRASKGRVRRPVEALYHRFHLSYFTAGSLRKLIESLGGAHVTLVTKEAHITRFGIDRYSGPARLAIRSFTLFDKMLGTQAKLLCAFQRPQVA